MENNRGEKRGWAIVAVSLLIGLLCVFAAGSLAIRFAPRWSLNADMRSRLEPDRDYLASRPDSAFQPVDAAILTPPVWINIFLTPGQTVPTRLAKATATKTEAPTQIPATPTITPTASPTPVFVVFTPTHTSAPAFTTTARPPTSTAPSSPVPTSPAPSPADLEISIHDGVSVYSAGGTLTYTVVVSNKGPASVSGATVGASLPVQVSNWSWACTSQTGGASGCAGMSGRMNFSNTLSLPAGSSVTYTVNTTIANDAQGDLTSSVSVSHPVPAQDPIPGNNASSDTNAAGVDLQISKTDGVSSYTPGESLTYTVVVTNNSSFLVNGASVTDTLPAQISSAAWQCWPEPGASCTPNGTGNISDTVSLPAGSRITYRILAVTSPYAVGTLTNTATVAAPAGFAETDPGNNRAEDSNICPTSEPDIGLPNGTWRPLPPGTSLTLVIHPTIVANGDLGTPDFVYYERLALPTNIELDSVQVEISADGTTWYQVFYWGDPAGQPDVNTNVDVKNLIGDVCPTEVDNCQIPTGRLYNSTGISVDVDGIVPPGNYAWIRLTSPPSVDNAEVDAIQPYYP